MNKLIILLIMIFLLMLSATLLYSHKLADLENLEKPEMMATDSSKLYILDGVKVYIYSMKDFRLLGELGKRGNGPGEFNPTFVSRIQLQLHNGNILLNSWNKMAWFSQEGMLIREKKFSFLVIQIVPLDQSFAVTRFFPGQDGRNQLTVQLMDKQLKATKTLYTREDISFRKSQKLDCPNEQIFVRYASNRLYILDQIQKEFHIRVFDALGNSLSPIKKDHAPLKMPESYKKEVLAWMNAQQSRFRSLAHQLGLSIDQVKQMIHYHPYVPAARYFTTHGKTLIIETFKKKENRSQFMVLDLEGKTLNKVYLRDAEPGRVKMSPTAAYTFYKNQHLFLQENIDTETWELHAESF